MHSLQSKAIYLQRQIYGNVLSFINHPSASKCRVVNSIKGFGCSLPCALYLRGSFAPVASVVLSSQGFFLTITYRYECFMSDKQTSNLGGKKESRNVSHSLAARGAIRDESSFQDQGPAGVHLIKCSSCDE